MENEQTPKTPLKTRIKENARKAAPYVVGFLVGTAVVTLDAFVKNANKQQRLIEKIANDTVQIERHDDGSITVSETVPPMANTED